MNAPETPLQMLVPIGQASPRASLSRALWATIRRDLLLAFRRKQDLMNPLVFFVMVVTLFPLGVSPDPAFLAKAGAGVVWVAALLATLLSMDHLFRHDLEDGALEQFVMQPHPISLLVFGRILAHWLVTGVPLILLSPILGVMVDLPGNLIGVLCLTLLLGTPILSLVGAIGAALTVGLRGGGVLLSLIILPLYIPVLVFGAGAVVTAASGVDYGGLLAILGALLALAVPLSPWAAGAALRVSLSNN